MRLTLDSWQNEILNTEGHICLCSGRQVGKSTIIAVKAGRYALKNFGKSVLIISATERQAEELFQKVLIYIDDTDRTQIKKGKDRPTKKIIKLKNGSIIRCLPTGLSGVGIRGFTIDMLIADEASFIPEAVWSAVTPMLLTTGGTIILVSTPFGKQGYFWERYNDPTFKTFHVRSEEVILNRPISASWTQAQREGALQHLERERVRMDKLQYAQEYLGEFVDDVRQFFPDELIRNCCVIQRKKNYEPRFKKNYLGVDIARMGGDKTAFEIIEKIDPEHYEHRENITKKYILTNETENLIKELHNIWNFKAIGIDAGSGSLGVGVFDHLRTQPKVKNRVVAINNRSRSLNADGTEKTRLLKEDLYQNLKAYMERGNVKLLDDEDLIVSLRSVQFEYVQMTGKATKVRIWSPKHEASDIVEGLIRALWLATEDKSLNIWVHYS